MWIFYAFGSAFFAGCMSILAKVGIRDVDSNLATALRTVIVVIFSWIMVFVAGSQNGISSIDGKSFIFLVLSGFATGGSWLCYFRALQLGDVNKVTPIDKSSTVLTMLLAFIFLGEGLGLLKVIAMLLIGIGTFLMIERKRTEKVTLSTGPWLIYALFSALFASLTSILAKVGIENVESNLGTAIRTAVVLIMAWVIVLLQKKQGGVKTISKRSWVFICLSGFATGFSWLCFYRALQQGPTAVVVPIDKLSILITVGFGCFALKEKIGIRALFGLIMIVIGTMSLLFA